MDDRSPPAIAPPPPGYLWHRQGLHLALLLVLGTATWLVAAPGLGDGALWGLSDRAWFALGLAVAIVHQVLVGLVWRAQLVSRLLTRWFGSRDVAVWAALFMPLLVARPLLLVALDLADAGSLGLPAALRWPLAAALLIPSLWTFWSVARYFGIWRAIGGDHFRERFRAMPLVRAGAFRITSNAMYRLGFLALWAIAVAGDSRAALALAAFQHAYIHVHLLCTEGPDMRLLYGGDAPTTSPGGEGR